MVQSVSPINKKICTESVQDFNKNDGLKNKIYKFVLAIFDIIKSVFYFPTRYLGAKTWSLPGLILSLPLRLFKKMHPMWGSSYYFSAQRQLTPEELRKDYLKCIASSSAAFKSDQQMIDGLNLTIHSFNPEIDQKHFNQVPGQLEVREKCLFDPTSSLKIVLSENDEEVIVSFGPIGAGLNEINDDGQNKRLIVKQTAYCLGNLIGLNFDVFDQAVSVVDALKAGGYFGSKKVTLVGQSFGSAFASYVGLQRNIQAVCINGLPLGAGLQQKIGDGRLMEADKYITNISVETDYVTDQPLMKIIDRILCFIGIRTCGNFGRRFKIPSAYSKSGETHMFVLGSAMKYLGYSERQIPADVFKTK